MLRRQQMIRVGDPILVDEVFLYAKSRNRKTRETPEHKFQGYSVKMNSVRYATFRKKGCICVRCGIEGTYFALERQENGNGNPNRYHLNLYGINKDGEEVLMTVDHTVPKTKGGKRIVENLQPMCLVCNGEKADENDEDDKKDLTQKTISLLR